MATGVRADEPPVDADVLTEEVERPGPRPEGERLGLTDRVAGLRAGGLRPWLPHLPVVALMVGYAAYFSRLTVELHRGYGTPGYDMGIFDQGIWLLSRFKAPFVTIMGRNLFGDHTSLILLLLVPVYWVYPHATALLVIQSGLLALGALPVYLLARARLHNNLMATLLAGAFLLHPALQWGNLEQFHPECFLVPLIGFAIYAAVTWKPWLLIVTAVGCLLVKEDVVLLIVPLGIWVAYRQNRDFGWRMVAAGILAALLLTEVLIRSLMGVPTIYANRIPFGGLGGFLSTALRRPGKLFDYLRSEGRPFYLWQMTFPSALVFLRAPEVAAVGLLIVASNIVSSFGYQHQIMYHYSMATVSVLAMGTVFAISALKSARQRMTAVGAVAVCSLFACFLWGALPAISTHKVPHWKPQDSQVHDINAVLAALPPNAVVSAHYSFVSHVDHRVRAYQWPTPFRATYWGVWQQEGQRLPFADQVQYLFLPVQLSQDDQVVFDHIKANFQVVKQVGYAMLLERQAAPGP
ncbi:MAG: DUF2079 domain-containing protein [Actinomycetota bacterium]|nr:DUF2079 domain-containing protein [Actinomycetota bacterium]